MSKFTVLVGDNGSEMMEYINAEDKAQAKVFAKVAMDLWDRVEIRENDDSIEVLAQRLKDLNGELEGIEVSSSTSSDEWVVLYEISHPAYTISSQIVFNGSEFAYRMDGEIDGERFDVGGIISHMAENGWAIGEVAPPPSSPEDPMKWDQSMREGERCSECGKKMVLTTADPGSPRFIYCKNPKCDAYDGEEDLLSDDDLDRMGQAQAEAEAEIEDRLRKGLPIDGPSEEEWREISAMEIQGIEDLLSLDPISESRIFRVGYVDIQSYEVRAGSPEEAAIQWGPTGSISPRPEHVGVQGAVYFADKWGALIEVLEEGKETYQERSLREFGEAIDRIREIGLQARKDLK